MATRAAVLVGIVFCASLLLSTVLPTHSHQIGEEQQMQQQQQQQQHSRDGGVGLGVSVAHPDTQIGSIDVSGNTVWFMGTAGDSPSSVVPGARNVLLLHGARFSARNWDDIGTLELLAEKGYRVVAVDLPVHVKEPSRDELLENICRGLGMTEDNPAVIVSPSMSGSFSIPLLLRKPTLFKGFVPVAPPNALNYQLADFENVKNVPALVVYGENDHMGTKVSNLLNAIPGSEMVMIEDAGHPAYLDDPMRFHAELVKFLEFVFRE